MRKDNLVSLVRRREKARRRAAHFLRDVMAFSEFLSALDQLEKRKAKK